jgi:hypothetical protein
MSEERKPITVPIKDLPTSKEIRSIIKTGKTISGETVHPDDRRNLRTAKILDLVIFGQEVDRANKALDDKMNHVIENVELAVKELNWNFLCYLSFLVDLSRQYRVKMDSLYETSREIRAEGAENPEETEPTALEKIEILEEFLLFDDSLPDKFAKFKGEADAELKGALAFWEEQKKKIPSEDVTSESNGGQQSKIILP